MDINGGVSRRSGGNLVLETSGGDQHLTSESKYTNRLTGEVESLSFLQRLPLRQFASWHLAQRGLLDLCGRGRFVAPCWLIIVVVVGRLRRLNGTGVEDGVNGP